MLNKASPPLFGSPVLLCQGEDSYRAPGSTLDGESLWCKTKRYQEAAGKTCDDELHLPKTRDDKPKRYVLQDCDTSLKVLQDPEGGTAGAGPWPCMQTEGYQGQRTWHYRKAGASHAPPPNSVHSAGIWSLWDTGSSHGNKKSWPSELLTKMMEPSPAVSSKRC